MNKSPNYCTLLILNTCPSDSQSPEWLLFLTIFIIMSVITLDEISWRWRQLLLLHWWHPGTVDRMVLHPALGTTAALSCHYCQCPTDKEDDLRAALQEWDHPRSPPWLSPQRLLEIFTEHLLETCVGKASLTIRRTVLWEMGHCNCHMTFPVCPQGTAREILRRQRENDSEMPCHIPVLFLRCDPENRQRVFIQFLQCP